MDIAAVQSDLQKVVSLLDAIDCLGIEGTTETKQAVQATSNLLGNVITIAQSLATANKMPSEYATLIAQLGDSLLNLINTTQKAVIGLEKILKNPLLSSFVSSDMIAPLSQATSFFATNEIFNQVLTSLNRFVSGMTSHVVPMLQAAEKLVDQLSKLDVNNPSALEAIDDQFVVLLDAIEKVANTDTQLDALYAGVKHYVDVLYRNARDIYTTLEEIKTGIKNLENVSLSVDSCQVIDDAKALLAQKLATLQGKINEIKTSLTTISDELVGIDLQAITQAITAVENEVKALVGQVDTATKDAVAKCEAVVKTVNQVVADVNVIVPEAKTIYQALTDLTTEIQNLPQLSFTAGACDTNKTALNDYVQGLIDQYEIISGSLQTIHATQLASVPNAKVAVAEILDKLYQVQTLIDKLPSTATCSDVQSRIESVIAIVEEVIDIVESIPDTITDIVNTLENLSDTVQEKVKAFVENLPEVIKAEVS
ncbi:MAG: hypothetical protein LBU27_04105 [Candidatus Peribacteria bacterium]|jgi:DNA-binding transcriptional MerR regulator|nr:hypothetical protein [Candidatus Peribacteria bacterium]